MRHEHLPRHSARLVNLGVSAGHRGNPFHVAALDPLRDAYAYYAQAPLSILAVLLSTIALVARYRRSRGVERQQLKRFASSDVLLALGSILISVDLVSFGE